MHGKALRASKPTANSGCALTVEGGINRSPMEPTRATVQLFQRAHPSPLSLARTFCANSKKPPRASDGNFTSALGIPTLDGMSDVGEGAHATHESILIEHFAPRTVLLAAMLGADAW